MFSFMWGPPTPVISNKHFLQDIKTKIYLTRKLMVYIFNKHLLSKKINFSIVCFLSKSMKFHITHLISIAMGFLCLSYHPPPHIPYSSITFKKYKNIKEQIFKQCKINIWIGIKMSDKWQQIN